MNFPNARSFEEKKGRVVTLQPGESRVFEIELTAHCDAASVEAAEKDVASIQAETKAEILTQPNPEWS